MSKTFTLDFTECSKLPLAYDEINRVIGFSGFGHNLDAFSDLLQGGFGHFEGGEKITIVIKGFRRKRDWMVELVDIIQEKEHITLKFE
eukprot:CAMPEP_0173415376 /NCGR_PEP_ID=MMETSP1356-20130122/84828_1 /TAXON_ID=77927 ORGANISM="Hemiselmis virescens, Strain PCC157" /NCGR_SAMPLE_ID=MMETSP1356 /ASSEMBLY_ACC=CAM_ASM_000847 /LENGTH=87 /DNA_ID=CAMNT_0014377619 /DNA_START=201 /DNA_END=464 /DNA_ORIENTATION=-